MGVEEDVELARHMAAPRIAKAVRLRDAARSKLGDEKSGVVDILDDEGVKHLVNFGKVVVLQKNEVAPEVLVFKSGDMANTVVAFFAGGVAEARVPWPCTMDIVKLRLEDGSFVDGRGRRDGRIIKCSTSLGLTPANDRCCSMCGAVTAAGLKLLRCSRCVDEGLEPHRYCSKACQRKAWPTHKTWHESVAQRNDGGERLGVKYGGWAKVRTALPSERAEIASKNGTTVEYLELGARASELRERGNFAKAVKTYKKMIALEPENWMSHYGLGQTHMLSGHPELAIASFDKAMESSRVGTLGWADGFLAAAVLIMSGSAEEDTLPGWWPERLKVMSKLAINGAREDSTLIGTARSRGVRRGAPRARSPRSVRPLDGPFCIGLARPRSRALGLRGAARGS